MWSTLKITSGTQLGHDKRDIPAFATILFRGMPVAGHGKFSAEFLLQPRSQGLSSLPPLVVGRKTLVAAGHMTTQILGGKKICWVGGVAEYFVWLM